MILYYITGYIILVSIENLIPIFMSVEYVHMNRVPHIIGLKDSQDKTYWQYVHYERLYY